MASQGRSRSAAFVGSVATEVIARGQDAVVLVGPMLDLDVERKGVIACIDETPASEVLLPVAAAFAALLVEVLDVITVAEPLLGSVAADIVHSVTSPVLVLPRPDAT